MNQLDADKCFIVTPAIELYSIKCSRHPTDSTIETCSTYRSVWNINPDTDPSSNPDSTVD